ncbi:MAG: FAD binding domain-containing protein [Propionibacteriaceae bacterium]|jgi:carbon-monoxide dehydrogenase medium subunit|nr:FAD binding domain-containing protein [Propionibacteriaceae bacterium]
MVVYYKPATVAEALDRLAEPRAKLLCGGTDLIVGLAADSDIAVVDLKGVSDLPAPLEITDTEVRFGPTYTMTELIAEPLLQAEFPALVEAASQVGSVAIRNRATLVGNLCNASPAADTPGPLLVGEATVEITGIGAAPLSEFFTGPKRTIAQGRIVTRVILPRKGYQTAYLRLTRRKALDLVTVAAAAAVRPGSAKLAFAAVAPTPVVSDWLPVDVADPAAIANAVAQAATATSPISDIRGSAEYRAAMVKVLGARAVTIAAARRQP